MIKLDYAAAPEAASIGRVRERYQMFLDGEFVDGHGPDLVSVNPSDETTLSTVSSASADDVDTAVRLARTAYEDVWSRLSGLERGKYLFRIARGIAERSRELAVLESLDNGKPIKETRDFDVPAAAQYFFSYAGWADKLQHLGYGPSPSALGVAGQVIPWNFPLLMAAWKIAPALAAGNTVVIKPAETTSLSILVLAEIMADAGLPAGVVNVLPGAGDIGAALVGHPGIDKVAFTGSTAVGKRIQTELAGTGRRLTLELGGKGANIVFDDAAVDQAVEGVVNGIFFNQGQVCCAGSRLLVQESVAEEFLDRLRARVETLRVGHALDKNTDVGAVNSRAQLDKITALTQSGVDEGAQRWVSPCPRAGDRPVRRADDPHRRQPVDAGQPGGDLRPGAHDADLPDPGGGDRQGQQHAVRAVGGGVDRQGLTRDGRRLGAACRCGLEQHVQPVRPRCRVRWLRRVRVRA